MGIFSLCKDRGKKTSIQVGVTPVLSQIHHQQISCHAWATPTSKLTLQCDTCADCLTLPWLAASQAAQRTLTAVTLLWELAPKRPQQEQDWQAQLWLHTVMLQGWSGWAVLPSDLPSGWTTSQGAWPAGRNHSVSLASHLSSLDRAASNRSQLPRFLLPLCSTGSEGRNSGWKAAVWVPSSKILLKIHEKLYE